MHLLTLEEDLDLNWQRRDHKVFVFADIVTSRWKINYFKSILHLFSFQQLDGIVLEQAFEIGLHFTRVVDVN